MMYCTLFNPETDGEFLIKLLSETDPKDVWTDTDFSLPGLLEIIRKGDGSPVGIIEFSEIDYVNERCCFGVGIRKDASPMQSLKLIVEFLKVGFSSGIDTVYTKVPKHNEHALKCNEFAGFVKEKCDLVTLGDITYDIIVMSINREQFERKWSKWVGEKQ